jgi:Adenine specific DNA methylase Mod
MTDLFGSAKGGKGSASNRLFYGDNLTIMQSINNGSVDLIYLDPPFNSQRSYNLIYKQATGLPVPEQEEAFCDSWELDPEKEEMARKMPMVLREYGVDESLVQFWIAWINALKNTQKSLLAYLIYMSYRLLEMKRVLKPTGSVYLHCDPTALHYIKVIMDGIFGHQFYRNDIVWKRTSGHSDARRYGWVHDNILFYTKTDTYTWNKPFQQYDDAYVEQYYRYTDEAGRRFMSGDISAAGLQGGGYEYEWKGVTRLWRVPRESMEQLDVEGRIFYTRNGIPRMKRYLDEAKGLPAQDVWTDVEALRSWHKERLGYPTQKPKALLDRIVLASSNPGDVVFDPFCGCGTAVYAAHENKRKWIGCDIAILSVRIVRDVLLKRYGLRENIDYQVSGIPLSVDGAEDLFSRDPRQFQNWVVELAGGFASKRHSGDLGVDGRIYFETSDGLKSMVLSVKGGKLTPAYVRELRGTMERDINSLLGGFICLQEPTKGMKEEAARAGQFTYLGKTYDRIQIRTAGDLLARQAFDTPSKVQTMDWKKQGELAL